MKGTIVFSNYSAFYKMKKKKFLVALDNVSLQIDGGQFVAVIGKSGCGKTTFLKSIAGFCDYSEGDIYIDGEKVSRKCKDISVAYVSQQYSLYPHLTVFENIAFPLRVQKQQHIDIVIAVKQVAKDLGIEMLLTRKPFQLSFGQQQKVAIARAIVKKPNILLLDEPFSNQDVISECILEQIIKTAKDNCSSTIVLATHNIEVAMKFADKAIIIDDGEVIEYGDAVKVLEEYRDNAIVDLSVIMQATNSGSNKQSNGVCVDGNLKNEVKDN